MSAPVSPFLKTSWLPADYFQLKDEKLKAEIKENGYVVLPGFFNTAVVEQLKAVYANNHSLQKEEGGLFVSIYSKNLSYRNKIHNEIKEVAEPLLHNVFTGFKVSSYNFIVKVPGPKSELFIHQDMALSDENLFSPLSIWSPLEKLDIENGPMCVIPKSHYTIPPHRSLDIELPFSKIYPLVFKYMKPVLMNPGDLLIFDSRLFHNSLVNSTNKNRVAVASSIFPAQCRFEILQKNKEAGENIFETIELEDDVFLTFNDFMSEKISRPDGKAGKQISIQPVLVSEEEFKDFAKSVGLEENNLQSYHLTHGIQTIAEHIVTVPAPAQAEKRPVISYFKNLIKKIYAN